MAELTGETWIYLVLALLIGLAVAWWIFVASRKTTITREEKADEVGPARRNQALIDAPPASAPGTTVSPAEVVAAGGDDLTRIKGLGPKVAALLHGLGVTSFAQIAAWDEAEIDRIDGQLGTFTGRIRRDDWQTQARLLAAGDTAAYEAKFGRL
jgi:predicted flap endonuclease-1-like 5' DNA nuclease